MSHQFKIGDIIQGEVTGIQKYGIFVKLDDETQGLVHISECQQGYVSEIDKLYQIGDQLKVMIIDIDEYSHQISLSIRQLIKTNTPPFPTRVRKKNHRYLPNIGFKTIDRKMSEWIDEGLKMIEDDQLDLNPKK